MKVFQILTTVFGLFLGLAPVLRPESALAENAKYRSGSDAAIVGSVNVRDQFKGGSKVQIVAPAPRISPAAAVQQAPVQQAPVQQAPALPVGRPNSQLNQMAIEAQSQISPDIVSKLKIPQGLEQPKIAEEAPDSFKCMALANQQGDKDTAQHCADMYVMYMANLMFQVRELTQMIGESLVRLGMVKEEDWVGAEQFINRELALARQEESTPFQATNEMALKRIKADPNQQAEVYFFCTLTNRFCRDMTPNVERLWRITKNDPNVKLVTVLIAESEPEFINSFREYTGLTAPVAVGPELAKKLRIGFVPAVVIRAPSTGQVYTKTGFQSFERMYQFVRTVQGRSIEITPVVKRIAAEPIGFEKGAKGFDWSKVAVDTGLTQASGTNAGAKSEKPVVGKF